MSVCSGQPLALTSSVPVDRWDLLCAEAENGKHRPVLTPLTMQVPLTGTLGATLLWFEPLHIILWDSQESEWLALLKGRCSLQVLDCLLTHHFRTSTSVPQ